MKQNNAETGAEKIRKHLAAMKPGEKFSVRSIANATGVSRPNASVVIQKLSSQDMCWKRENVSKYHTPWVVGEKPKDEAAPYYDYFLYEVPAVKQPIRDTIIKKAA